MANQEATCCQKFAKAILIFINSVFFILGAAVLGMAVYLNYASVSWFAKDQQAIFSTTGLYAAMIFGGVIMALSLAGCVGAMKGADGCGKCFLFFYSATVLVVILVQLIGGIMVLVLAGQLGDFGKNEQVHKAATEFDKAVEKFANQTYQTCCGPKGSEDDICKLLLQTTPPVTECGKGEKKFADDLYQWVSKNFSKVGIGFIIIGAIEVLGLIMSCHLMCWSGRKAKTPEPIQGSAYVPPQQQHGGDLAYGGAPATHNSYA